MFVIKQSFFVGRGHMYRWLTINHLNVIKQRKVKRNVPEKYLNLSKHKAKEKRRYVSKRLRNLIKSKKNKNLVN